METKAAYETWEFDVVISENVPVAARSKAWVCGRSLAEIAGSNPTGGYGCLSVESVVCCAGRGLCDGLITRPEETYRLWCVWVWLWILHNEKALAHWGCCAMVKKKPGSGQSVDLLYTHSVTILAWAIGLLCICVCIIIIICIFSLSY